MRNLLAGILIGIASTAIAVACGVPDHKHNTNDIQANNNTDGGSGACTCKEPTNTIRVVEKKMTCKGVDIEGSKHTPLLGVEFQDIISILVTRISRNGVKSKTYQVPRLPSGGSVPHFPCGTDGEAVDVRVLVR